MDIIEKLQIVREIEELMPTSGTTSTWTGVQTTTIISRKTVATRPAWRGSGWDGRFRAPIPQRVKSRRWTGKTLRPARFLLPS